MARKQTFSENGEAPQDDVEKALLRRALGFRQEEIHTEDLCDKKTGEVLEAVKRRTVIKDIAPDVRALLFWLKNWAWIPSAKPAAFTCGMNPPAI